MLLSLSGGPLQPQNPRQADLPSQAQQQEVPLLLRGAQQVTRDPHSLLDHDSERKAFPMGAQLREPGTPTSTPKDVAGDLRSSEVQAQGTGEDG